VAAFAVTTADTITCGELTLARTEFKSLE